MKKHIEEKLEKYQSLSKEELAKKFKCLPEEIWMGDYIARNTKDKVCPYKVIMGFADFENSQCRSLGDLEVVFGRKFQDSYGPLTDTKGESVYLGINLRNSYIIDTENLKQVYGSITLHKDTKTLGNIEFLGSNLYLNGTRVVNLGNLKEVAGRLNLEDIDACGGIKSLSKVKKIGTLYIDSRKLQDLGDCVTIENVIYGPHCNKRTVNLIESNFVRAHGKYKRELIENVTV